MKATTAPTKISKNLQKGEKLARLSYLTVVNPRAYSGNGKHAVTVQNEKGKQWDIDRSIIDNECISANQFFETVKESRTNIIELMLNAKHKLFTVNFFTKPDPKAALKKLQDAYPNKGIKGVGIMKRDDYNELMKDILAEIWHGNNRTMIARFESFNELSGRINAYDMEKEGFRQIDPRTVEWLIIDGIKYEVK